MVKMTKFLDLSVEWTLLWMHEDWVLGEAAHVSDSGDQEAKRNFLMGLIEELLIDSEALSRRMKS